MLHLFFCAPDSMPWLRDAPVERLECRVGVDPEMTAFSGGSSGPSPPRQSASLAARAATPAETPAQFWELYCVSVGGGWGWWGEKGIFVSFLFSTDDVLITHLPSSITSLQVGQDSLKNYKLGYARLFFREQIVTVRCELFLQTNAEFGNTAFLWMSRETIHSFPSEKNI